MPDYKAIAHLLRRKEAQDALKAIATPSRNYPWAALEAAKLADEKAGVTPPVIPPVVIPPVVEPPKPPVTPPSGGTKIADQSQLDAALKNKAGGILSLAEGDYSVVLANIAYAAPMVLTSANPAKPANIGWHKLTNVTNLTFSGVSMKRAPSAANPISDNIGKAAGVVNLTYDNITFNGSANNDPGKAMTGILVNGTNVTISNCDIAYLFKGFLLSGSNLKVLNNKFHDLRSDGFNISNSDGVWIDGNHGTNFARATEDHPDFIQFLTNGKAASRNVVITNNVWEQGAGNGVQFIFLRDEMKTMPYVNIRIENNIGLLSNMSNGITVSHGSNIVIRNNTLISPLNDGSNVWIRFGPDGPVTNATVQNNVADSYNGAPTAGNWLLKDVASAEQRTLLTTGVYAKLKASQMVIAGKGYQPL